MNDAENRQPEPIEENGARGHIGDPADSLTDADPTGRTAKSADSEDLSTEIARFSRLGSEMKDCLSSLLRRTKDAVDLLGEIQKSVERKKGELRELHAIEASAASLKELEEEHRIRQEEFAASMEDRRRRWAEEEDLRRREEEKYRENLNELRQQQQREHERKMAEEQSLLRNKMEEELREREQALNGREAECDRLIQELELFMKRLAGRKVGFSGGAFSSTAPASGAEAHSDECRSGEDSHSSGAVGSGDAYQGSEESMDRDEGPSVISVRRMLLRKDPLGSSRLAGEEIRDPHTLEDNS